jgi:hypothetical protein
MAGFINMLDNENEFQNHVGKTSKLALLHL